MADKLVLEHISYVYSKNTPFETEALSDVSVAFETGKITGLIGHTGSGKSTLVQMLNGLLRPTSGRVLLDGTDIFSLKKKELAKICFRVGLVMQYPEYQLFDETVRRDIGYGPRNMRLSEEEVAERVTEGIRFAEFPEALLDKSPFELSGGQKRRAAIAGVMAMRPEVLVLDEPAAGLDPRGKTEILSGIREYAKKTGATVILVSHSMEDMALYCDNIAVMNHGRLYTYGKTEEVFGAADLLSEAGLDIPEVSRIAVALRRLGYPLTGKLYTVDGVADVVLRLIKGGDGRD